MGALDLETLVNFANRPKVTHNYDAHARLRGALPIPLLHGIELPASKQMQTIG